MVANSGTYISGKRTADRTWGMTRIGRLASVILAILAIAAVFAPVVAPFDPFKMDSINSFEAPSLTHVFGTDEFGRDIFSRVIYGTRISVFTAALVVTAACVLGGTLGLVAGYYSNTVAESVIMRLIDTILAFPAILLAMALIAALGRGTINSAIAVIVVSIPTFARLIRATVLQQKEMDYVEASRAAGASDFWIVSRVLLPNTLPPILVQAAVNATWAIQLEAGLSFLGLGVTPPQPSLGQMLDTGRDYLYRAPWYGLFPGIALVLLVLSLNILADSLQKKISHGRIQ